jgi:hypothetical protein
MTIQNDFDKLEKKTDELVDDSSGLSINSIAESSKQIESVSAETMKVKRWDCYRFVL